MAINHIPVITYPTIFIAVFANQVCLPVPAVLFLMTAGALVASGSLNLGSVILASVVGSLLADYAWFMLGRWQGYRVVRALCSFSMDGQHCSIRARRFFSRRGLPGLMFAKFVPGLDGLMPPLAGALNVTTVLFLIFGCLALVCWVLFCRICICRPPRRCRGHAGSRKRNPRDFTRRRSLLPHLESLGINPHYEATSPASSQPHAVVSELAGRQKGGGAGPPGC
jgi:membrane protein DedA with SNARE-associated domain